MPEQELAFVFPGQGSQSTGMLSELAESYSQVEDTFAIASNILGYNLWEIVQHNKDGELDRTRFTQPALLTASIAIWKIWQDLGGPAPAVVAGHSLGEYSALVVADVLQLEDAIALVADRGKFMQEAVPEGEGAMAAILGLEDEQVVNLCAEMSDAGTVSAANFNTSGQVVIAGSKNAVEQAVQKATDIGAKRAMMLAVSVPSHCALMLDAASRFSERLGEVRFQEASIPVIQNVDAQARTDAEGIKAALIEQLHQSVLWWKSVETLKDMGAKRVVECGPGKVLAGLIKRIDRGLEVMPVFDSVSLEKALNRGEQ